MPTSAAAFIALLASTQSAPSEPLPLQDLSRTPAAAEIASLVVEKRAIGAIDAKIDSRLHTPLPPRRGQNRGTGLVSLVGFASANRRGSLNRVYVDVADGGVDALETLRRRGLKVEIVNSAIGRVQGWVDDVDLQQLAALDVVRAVRPADLAWFMTGSVTSEGDAVSRADLVRALGYDGTGVSVGVISDGISSLAAAQATLDLGAVDAHCGPGSGDEGTALLEIVHDLAPGAQLLFASVSTSLSFIASVNCLTAAGVRVLADDVFFPGEPYFEDGAVARAVRAAVQAGVSYHSSAGNSAQVHLEQPYRPSPSTDFHDFLGGPVDNIDDIAVPAFGTLRCVLQWNDPFGASGNDYDLYVVDQSQNVIASSRNLQTGTQDPLEAVAVRNLASFPQSAGIVIKKFAGDSRLLKLYCLGAAAAQYVTPAGSIAGHAALPEVVTVAAMNVADPGFNQVEPFSSQGPSQIFFPSSATRAKPDITAYDGVRISNAGGFPPCNMPPCPFFGTSAAVPHSAAVAALLLNKNRFLAPAEVQDVLRRSAIDVPPLGFDPVAGAGRLDAFGAAGLVAVPECDRDAGCDDGNPCTRDRCDRGRCVHPPLACDDGNACNGVETCDPARGCIAGEPPVCADADPCTTDSCDRAAGCRNIEVPGIGYVDCAIRLRLGPLLPAADSVGSRHAHRALLVIGAKLRKADHLVQRANSARSRAARKQLHAARSIIRMIETLSARLASDIGPPVIDAIRGEAERIATRIDALARAL